jgi:lipopolysaccharide export system permease protein
LWRIARPIYILGAAGLVCGLYVNLQFMPVARVKYKQELLNAVQTDPKLLLLPKTFIRDFRGAVVYANEREGDILKDVWVWNLDDQSRVIRLSKAESGKISYDDATGELIFTPLKSSVEQREEGAPEDAAKIRTGVGDLPPLRVSLEKLFGKQALNRKPDWLTFPVLVGEIARLKRPVPGGDEAARVAALTKHRIVLQDKLAKAVAVLAFVFIAVPLGIKVSRRETSANLVVAVALALAYYFLTEAAKWLEGFPQARPDLLLWVPNLIFVYLGLRWMKRVQSA